MQTSASLVYATRIGGKTIDRDSQGGNPFATALVEATTDSSHSLGSMLGVVAARTRTISSGLQKPIWALHRRHSKWQVQRSDFQPRERRVALVVVAYDYQLSELGFLTGAAIDQRRVASLFARLGFSVTQDVGPSKQDVINALQIFAKTAARADAAFIYCTGHGIHAQGKTFLLPCDYPADRGYASKQVLKYAIPVERLALACQARSTNVLFLLAAEHSAMSPNPLYLPI